MFSLSRHKDPATGSKVLPLMAQFSEIKATGPMEVQITLSRRRELSFAPADRARRHH